MDLKRGSLKFNSSRDAILTFGLLTLFFLTAIFLVAGESQVDNVIGHGNTNLTVRTIFSNGYLSGRTNFNFTFAMEVASSGGTTSLSGEGNITIVTLGFLNGTAVGAGFAGNGVGAVFNFSFLNNTYPNSSGGSGGIRGFGNITGPGQFSPNFTIDTTTMYDWIYDLNLALSNISALGVVRSGINSTAITNMTIDNTFPKIGQTRRMDISKSGNMTSPVETNNTLVIYGNVTNFVVNLTLTERNLGQRAGNISIFVYMDNGSAGAGGIISSNNWTLVNISSPKIESVEVGNGFADVAAENVNISLNLTQYFNGAIANNSANNTRYLINISATDLAGNANISAYSFLVILDNIVPQIDFSAQAITNGTSLNGNFVVNYSLSETNPINVTYRLYNATNGAINVTTLRLFAIPNQTLPFINYSAQATSQLNTNGLYFVNITVVDAVLLSNTTYSRSYFWDTAVPSVALQTDESSNTMTKGDTAHVTCSTPDADAAGRPARSVVINSTTDRTSICSATNASACTAAFTPANSGTNNLYCQIVDLAGNRAFTSLALTVNPSSGGSGGGGSTGGGSAAYSGVAAGTENTYSLGNTAVGVDSVKFTTNANVDTAKVSVNGLTAPSGGAPAPSTLVFKYFEVTKTGFDNSQVAKSSVVFTVSKAWLETQKLTQDQVVLLKYADDKSGWKELSTSFVKADGDLLYFSADTQGFSLFAISTKSAPTTVTTTSGTGTETSTTGTQGTTTPAVTTPVAKSKAWIWVVVALVVVVVIVVVMMKKRGGKSEWSHRSR